MKPRISLILVFLALVGCASRPHPTIPKAVPSEQFRLEEAIQRGDHQALAHHYREMAQRERETTKIHDRAGTYYRRSPHYGRSRKKMTNHCHQLKWEALERAKTYDQLADEEEKLVKE